MDYIGNDNIVSVFRKVMKLNELQSIGSSLKWVFAHWQAKIEGNFTKTFNNPPESFTDFSQIWQILGRADQEM